MSSIYVTFRPGTFSKLGGNESLELKSTHVITHFSQTNLSGNVSFGIKKYPCQHYICNILARHIFKIRQ